MIGLSGPTRSLQFLPRAKAATIFARLKPPRPAPAPHASPGLGTSRKGWKAADPGYKTDAAEVATRSAPIGRGVGHKIASAQQAMEEKMRRFWGDARVGPGGDPRLVLVGHRGMGKNKLPIEGEVPDPRPSILENTILSFNRAATSGADFVEFDVQVTKDGHPVLFHDDLILTSDGLAKKIRELSLDEFRAIGLQRSSETVGKALLRRAQNGAAIPWTANEKAPLGTLVEAFAGVEPSCGFNVEVKFAEEQAGDVEPAEIHRMVDAILEVVSQHGQDRKVFFSSFHPDAVIEIRRRQSTNPVLFLTDGGGTIYEDPRMNSIAAAIALCKANNLDGIVSEVKAILANPKFAVEVKEAGLQLLTYGELNNVPEALYFQQYHGVDGVIVDHVHEMATVVNGTTKEKFTPPFGRFGDGVEGPPSLR